MLSPCQGGGARRVSNREWRCTSSIAVLQRFPHLIVAIRGSATRFRQSLAVAGAEEELELRRARLGQALAHHARKLLHVGACAQMSCAQWFGGMPTSECMASAHRGRTGMHALQREVFGVARLCALAFVC